MAANSRLRRAWGNTAVSLTATLFLSILVGVAGMLVRADEPMRLIGTFRVTHYYIAQERTSGDWPLYAPACEQVIAHTSARFHRAISLEGTGRLGDGRLLNFSERCPCARPGFRGNRICYEVLDQTVFPWGRGARFGQTHAPLVPFRSVAVDPDVVPLGTVLYVPEWQGRAWPDGRTSDGCVRAEDTGSMIRQRHLDLFVGHARWAESLDSAHTVGQVRVYTGHPGCRQHKQWSGG